MKVFFREQMSIESGGFSPSASKPSKVARDWLAHGLAIQICDFEPATEADLCLAHDQRFVRAVLAGERNNGHGNRIPEVTESCLLTAGSMMAACRTAIEDRITCSPTSGFHHAGFDFNGAFCSFNSLIVSARTVIDEGLCSKVAILDCDAHYGDGTEDIIQRLNLHDQIKHWTYGAHWGRAGGFIQRRFLRQINAFLTQAARSGVGLVIYQAGADPHIDDPLGGDMTSSEMRRRDRVVFEECKALKLAVAFNLAGGYSRDNQGTIAPVLALHRATVEEALRVFG